MSILVLGDAMIDKHTRGSVNRISPEAPVPVVHAGSDSVYSLGAAANVAAQVAALGIDCIFAYKAFESDPDGSHKRLTDMCSAANIKPFPLTYPDISFPVTTKERIWTEGQQLCRIDRELTVEPDDHIRDFWHMWIGGLISDQQDISVVIFSDYNKGTLTDWLIQAVTEMCNLHGIKTILDPKRYSYCDLENLTLVKPNVREIAITNMNASQVSKHLGHTLLLNTLGAGGMELWKNGHAKHREEVYAKPNEIVDVCGCGDTVSAFLGAGFYYNLSIEDSIEIASLAAAENARHRGCYTLSKEEAELICKIEGRKNARA